MNHEPQPNKSQPNHPQYFTTPELTTPASDAERSELEQQLSKLRPHALQIDDQSLDALLASRHETGSPAQGSPLLPAVTLSGSRSWGTLAAAWSFGVAVGVLAMLAIQSAQQPSPIAEEHVATVAPVGPEPTVQPLPTTSAVAADGAPSDSSTEATPAIAEATWSPERRVAATERSPLDSELWQANLFDDALRVGTHIYITTKLTPPSSANTRALEKRDAKWPRSAGGLRERAREPWSSPPIATPRSTIDELLGEGSNVF